LFSCSCLNIHQNCKEGPDLINLNIHGKELQKKFTIYRSPALVDIAIIYNPLFGVVSERLGYPIKNLAHGLTANFVIMN
jgi:hypothetical protein